jgi:hypothetical protein
MAWVAVGAAAVSVVGGSLLADDNGAEGANNAAADSTRLQSQIAQDQWNRYKQIYAPLERGMVTEAQNYDSPENYAKAAGDAQATVSSQFGKARDRLSRTPGLDPSSGAYQSSLVGLDLAQAATDATQQNIARQRVKDTAYARKTDALSLGKGLPAQASSQLATASQQSLAQAKYGTALGMDQAGAIGRATDRIFSSPTVSNWLGNAGGKSGAAQTYSDATSFASTNNSGWLDF